MKIQLANLAKLAAVAAVLALSGPLEAAAPPHAALSSVQLLVPPTVVLSPPLAPRSGVPFHILGSATATRGLSSIIVDLDGLVSTLHASGIGVSLARIGVRPVPVGRGRHTLVVQAQDVTGAVGTATVRFTAF